MVNWYAVSLAITLIYILPKRKIVKKIIKFYNNRPIKVRPKTVIAVLDDIGMNFEKTLRQSNAGSRIIIASQYLKKAEIAKDELSEPSKNKNISIVALDRCDENSVVEFAQYIMENEQYVDVLINNEGFDLTDLNINFKKQELSRERFLNHCLDFLYEDEIDSITKYKLPGWYITNNNT